MWGIVNVESKAMEDGELVELEELERNDKDQ